MAMQAGLSHEEAKEVVSKKVPPEASVPIYDKRGTETLKRHLLDWHSIDVSRPEAAAGRTAFNQPSIAAAFQTLSAKANEAEVKAALVYCMNPAVPFRLGGDGYFLQASQSVA